jgi:hypothetical protein
MVPAVSHDAVDEDPPMVTCRSSLSVNLNLVAMVLELRCHNFAFLWSLAPCRLPRGQAVSESSRQGKFGVLLGVSTQNKIYRFLGRARCAYDELRIGLERLFPIA